MVSSAKIAGVGSMMCLRLASLVAFVLSSSPSTKVAFSLFLLNAPSECFLVAQKNAETVIPEEWKNEFASIDIPEESLAATVQHQLLRIAQEAISNAVRHANPTVVYCDSSLGST